MMHGKRAIRGKKPRRTPAAAAAATIPLCSLQTLFTSGGGTGTSTRRGLRVRQSSDSFYSALGHAINLTPGGPNGEKSRRNSEKRRKRANAPAVTNVSRLVSVCSNSHQHETISQPATVSCDESIDSRYPPLLHGAMAGRGVERRPPNAGSSAQKGGTSSSKRTLAQKAGRMIDEVGSIDDLCRDHILLRKNDGRCTKQQASLTLPPIPTTANTEGNELPRSTVSPGSELTTRKRRRLRSHQTPSIISSKPSVEDALATNGPVFCKASRGGICNSKETCCLLKRDQGTKRSALIAIVSPSHPPVHSSVSDFSHIVHRTKRRKPNDMQPTLNLNRSNVAAKPANSPDGLERRTNLQLEACMKFNLVSRMSTEPESTSASSHSSNHSEDSVTCSDARQRRGPIRRAKTATGRGEFGLNGISAVFVASSPSFVPCPEGGIRRFFNWKARRWASVDPHNDETGQPGRPRPRTQSVPTEDLERAYHFLRNSFLCGITRDTLITSGRSRKMGLLFLTVAGSLTSVVAIAAASWGVEVLYVATLPESQMRGYGRLALALALSAAEALWVPPPGRKPSERHDDKFMLRAERPVTGFYTNKMFGFSHVKTEEAHANIPVLMRPMVSRGKSSIPKLVSVAISQLWRGSASADRPPAQPANAGRARTEPTRARHRPSGQVEDGRTGSLRPRGEEASLRAPRRVTPRGKGVGQSLGGGSGEALASSAPRART